MRQLEEVMRNGVEHSDVVMLVGSGSWRRSVQSGRWRRKVDWW